jgi:hypothetical protein
MVIFYIVPSDGVKNSLIDRWMVLKVLLILLEIDL